MKILSKLILATALFMSAAMNAQRVVTVVNTNGVLLTPSASKFATANGLVTADTNGVLRASGGPLIIDGAKTAITNVPLSSLSSFYLSNIVYAFQASAATVASIGASGGTLSWTNSTLLLTPYSTNTAAQNLDLWLSTGQPYNTNYWWTLSMDVLMPCTNEGIWFYMPGSSAGGNGYALRTNNLSANTWTHLSSTFPGSASSSLLYVYVATNGITYPVNITNQANTVTISNFTIVSSTNYNPFASSSTATYVNPTNFTPRVILPSEIVGVVGDELQVYTRSVLEAQNPYTLPYQMTCPVGSAYPRYFDLTPTAPSTNTLTVSVLDDTGAALASTSTSLTCVNNRAAPATMKNVLCVGDSLTAGGEWASEFYRRLTQSGGVPTGNGYTNITFIGNQSMSAYPAQKYIGYGGWTWDSYLGTTPNTAAWVACPGHGKDTTDQKSVYKDANGNQWQIETIQTTQVKMIPSGGATSYSMPAAPNTLTWVMGGTHTGAISYTAATPDSSTPFWNGSQFSFSGFCSNAGYTNIDIVYVLLGWNGLAGPNKPNASDHANQTVKAQQFINQLHADYPNVQVRILGIEVPSVNGGLAANYGATGTYANYYNLLRSVNGLRLGYQTLTTNSFVKYIDVAAVFDSENNMQQTTTAVNSRNATTESRGSNGVHPASQGYLQIADAAWRDFIRTYCQ